MTVHIRIMDNPETKTGRFMCGPVKNNTLVPGDSYIFEHETREPEQLDKVNCIMCNYNWGGIRWYITQPEEVRKYIDLQSVNIHNP